MAKTLQFKRYSTSQLSGIAGAQGELFVDTNQYTISVHDGINYAGTYLATQGQLNSNTLYMTGVNASQNANINFVMSLANTAVLNTGPQLIFGNVWISNTTASTSNTTGALVVAGGAGVTGNVYIAGNLTVLGNTNLAITYDNSLIISNTAATTSNSTGALQVRGGAGVAGNLYVTGSNTVIAGNLYVTGANTVLGNTALGNTYVTGTVYQNGFPTPTLATVLTFTLAF